MEGDESSEQKGSDNDESLSFGSSGKKRKSPGVEKTDSSSERAADKGHDDSDKVGARKSKKVILFLLFSVLCSRCTHSRV